MPPLAAVAPPTGLVLSADDAAALAARAVVRFHLHAFARMEGAARAGEVEGVHQLRVATRRLRAALRLFVPLLPDRFVESGQRDLAWLAGGIGTVRDLDVLNETIKERAVRLDPELRAALGPVGLAIHDQRVAALEALVAMLDSTRCRRLFDRLAAFGEGTAAGRRRERLGDLMLRLVRPLLRSVVRNGRRLGPESSSAELHRLRVRVKRLRYALESTRGFTAKPVRRLLDALEQLQDIFGAHQDAVAQIAWLRLYARTPGVDAASLLPVGALMQALARQAGKRRRRALKAWRKVDRSGLFDAASAELAEHAAKPALEATAT